MVLRSSDFSSGSCSCPVNGMVVGSDLYEKTKNFREYSFKYCGNFSIDLKYHYPIFEAFRNKTKK